MIRMSVLYPSAEGSTFDHDYYANKHVPFCLETWAPTSFEINKGIDGPYVAAVHFLFDSMEDLGAAMAKPESEAVKADVPNYTNIVPVAQISEIA